MNPHINELTYEIIGAAIEVHRALGPGCWKRLIVNVFAGNSHYGTSHFSASVVCLFNIKEFSWDVVTGWMC